MHAGKLQTIVDTGVSLSQGNSLMDALGTIVPSCCEKDLGEESDLSRRIRIRGINGDIEGKMWESESLLRAGRLATLEMVLDDTSVSRRHAEIRSTPQGWRVRDLGSTNGTFLNGSRLEAGEWPLRPNDI